jgi:hypothetical protein
MYIGWPYTTSLLNLHTRMVPQLIKCSVTLKPQYLQLAAAMIIMGVSKYNALLSWCSHVDPLFW